MLTYSGPTTGRNDLVARGPPASALSRGERAWGTSRTYVPIRSLYFNLVSKYSGNRLIRNQFKIQYSSNYANKFSRTTMACQDSKNHEKYLKIQNTSLLFSS